MKNIENSNQLKHETVKSQLKNLEKNKPQTIRKPKEVSIDLSGLNKNVIQANLKQ